MKKDFKNAINCLKRLQKQSSHTLMRVFGATLRLRLVNANDINNSVMAEHIQFQIAEDESRPKTQGVQQIVLLMLASDLTEKSERLRSPVSF